MDTMSFLKTTVSFASFAVVLGTNPSASQAQSNYNMCDLDKVPPECHQTGDRAA